MSGSERIPCRADSTYQNTEMRADMVWSVRGTRKLLIGSSWNLTFMQNQIEKGKVTMTKSRVVRTRSHSQAPKLEDLVP